MSQVADKFAIEPRFKIRLTNAEWLMKDWGLQDNEIKVALSARVSRLKTYRVLDQWPMGYLPEDGYTPAPDLMIDLQSGQRIDFTLVVRTTGARSELKHQRLGGGRVLCRQTFSLLADAKGPMFPMEWIEFGTERYPENLLWSVDWIDSDGSMNYDVPVDEALMVRANTRAQEMLLAAAEPRTARDLPWRMLAADIYVQICFDVLSNYVALPNENEINTVAGQVFARLAQASEPVLSYSNVKELHTEDGLHELRRRVAACLKVVG